MCVCVCVRLAVPIGISTSLDACLYYSAFLYISVSFYTIIKSSGIIWTMIWSFVFKLETISAKLIGVILLFTIGVTLSSLDQFKGDDNSTARDMG